MGGNVHGWAGHSVPEFGPEKDILTTTDHKTWYGNSIVPRGWF